MRPENPDDLRLSELYQEVILDHNRKPRNFKKIAGATAEAHGKNPLCGDDYFLYLVTDKDGVIRDIGFEGSGCAISKSSASMMTDAVKGKSAKEAGLLKDDFIRLLTAENTSGADLEKVGKLKLFEGVRNFPVRVKCAALIWRTLEEALKGNGNKEISTE